MDPLLDKLEGVARRLARSLTSTTSLVSVDESRQARASIDHLVGALLRDSTMTWRVRWLNPSTSAEALGLAHEASRHNEPLLLILDASQAALTAEDRHEGWLRELNTQRELLRPKDALVVTIIVAPTWLGRRFPELAPDTYSILGPIVEVGLRRRRLELDGSGLLDHMHAKFEERLDESDDRRARYAHGTYELCYQLRDAPWPSPDGEQVLEHLAAVRGHTGWRPWWVPTRDPIRPRVRGEDNDQVECWMFDNRDASPARSDYWLVNGALLYLLRGYDEDSHPADIVPGTQLSASLPLWRAGEALLHTLDYATLLGAPETRVEFTARWSGLKGRELTGWPSAWDRAQGRATDDVVIGHVEFGASQIASLATLSGVVSELTRPLFESFGHRPARNYVETQLKTMMKP